MASFAEIETTKDLIAYLDDKERLKHSNYLCHYTTIQNAIAIFKSKTWHLGNPRNMNDMVEYNNGDSKRWENIFFASFATVYKGNIIKNLIMDCQSYTKYRPSETTGGIFVSWRRKEELPTGA